MPPVEEPEKPKDEQLKSITKASVERMLKRIRSSVEKSPDLEPHQKVFLEAIPNREDIINKYFENWQTELDAVLPEQRVSAINRININKLVEDLCQKKE